MQAVILAAGKSSRFYPYNLFHKSLISIMGKPIIEHTLDAVKKSGIKDVIIITHADGMVKKSIDETKIGMRIRYVVQPQALGMGDALLQAKEFIESDFFLLHAHHVDFSGFKRLMENKRKTNKEVVLLAKKDIILYKFGVLEVKKDRVLDIIEKPKTGKEPSHLRVIGIYLLTKEFLETLFAIPSEHYHFEKALSRFAKEGDVRVAVTEDEVVTLKHPWDMLLFKNYLLNGIKTHVSKNARISKSAQLSGSIIIESGAKIMDGACIKGPSYIGHNVIVGNNALLRDAVSLEKNSLVGAQTEVKNTLIGPGSTVHSGVVLDSIIGEGCKIGALFCTANVRLDRKNIQVEVNSEKVDTGLRNLGLIMGGHVRAGIRVSTMPGVVIGNNVIIGPSTTVMKNVDDNVKIYSKFKEFVELRDSKANNQQKFVLLDIDYTLFDTRRFKDTKLQKYSSYEEVIDVLFELGKIARLGIFSEGELDFQRKKLTEMKVLKHFLDEDIHIVPNKDETIKTVLQKYKDHVLFIVDDKLPILYTAKMHLPSVYTIWVKRGVYAKNQKPIKNFKPDVSVKNLRDIVAFIESIS